ncbi:hypothetical protein LCGC14_0164170 [marine sediment metagenome]|uniref:Uncharacterized protein n=1 Tax=marine sediment metagenome TaxID=412755 RepID=A0A0F9XWL4_9ZZZZ
MEYYESHCPDCNATYRWVGYKTGIGKTPEQLAAMNRLHTTCERCGSTNLKTGLDHGSPEAQAYDSALKGTISRMLQPTQEVRTVKTTETKLSDDVCLTCLFSHMEQVSVEDGKLKVLGRLGYPPVLKGSVEADFKIEVEPETGHLRALVAGPIRTDSHPIKYRVDVAELGMRVHWIGDAKRRWLMRRTGKKRWRNFDGGDPPSRT